MSVQYKDVPGFPGYRVGDDGSVWSRRSRHGETDWHELTARPSKRGYRSVLLCFGKRSMKKGVRVNRLVLMAFVGPCQEGMEAAHENGIRDDNRLVNLNWKTPKDNFADRKRHGTYPVGEKSARHKLDNCKVGEIRARAGNGELHTSIARDLGVSIATIGHVVKRKTWQHI